MQSVYGIAGGLSTIFNVLTNVRVLFEKRFQLFVRPPRNIEDEDGSLNCCHLTQDFESFCSIKSIQSVDEATSHTNPPILESQK